MTGGGRPSPRPRSSPSWRSPARSRSPIASSCSPHSPTARRRCARRSGRATASSWSRGCARSAPRFERMPATGGFGDDLRVIPADELLGSTTIDCGLAGTVMRFLPPVAALALGPTTFDGDEGARRRPMGGSIDGAARARRRPRRRRPRRPAVHRARHRSGRGRRARDRRVGVEPVRVGPAALGAAVRAGTRPAPRRRAAAEPAAHRDDDRDPRRARRRGRRAPSPDAGRSHPGPIRAIDVDIEPDLSNAAPFLVAALVAGGSVTITGWPAETTQVGAQLAELLPRFGARVDRRRRPAHRARARPGADGGRGIRGVDLDLSEAGELVPNLVALAAFADGPSTFTGIGHIRHHETDRLAALAAELNGLGGAVTELDDGLRIEPAPLTAARGARTPTTAWRRPARSSASRSPGVVVDDIGSTSKTLPQFTEALGADARMTLVGARTTTRTSDRVRRVRRPGPPQPPRQPPAHQDAPRARRRRAGHGARRRPRPLRRARRRGRRRRARDHRGAGERAAPQVGRDRRPRRPRRRHDRRARHARPHRAHRRAHRRSCAAAPTTPTRSSASSSRTPTRCSSSSPRRTPSRASASSTATSSPPSTPASAAPRASPRPTSPIRPSSSTNFAGLDLPVFRVEHRADAARRDHAPPSSATARCSSATPASASPRS